MRVVIALGGNAMTSADGRARPEDQIAAVELAVERITSVVATGADVVLTHGNGPQVGNLLVKNEIAASVVPPVPLDWCDAQTQGTIGFILLNALHNRRAAIKAATLVTRTLVDGRDPAFTRPTKPIGRYLPEAEARVMIEHGQHWQDRGENGWRRIVASPEPLEILDAPAVTTLLAAGYLVIAGGGGGIPVVREEGRLRGIEAVIDKDLASVLLARAIGADTLVIATDVPNVMLHYGTPDQRPLGEVRAEKLRAYAAEGHFASGSMAPKVEAACRFVEGGGTRAVITSLPHIADPSSGTVVTP